MRALSQVVPDLGNEAMIMSMSKMILEDFGFFLKSPIIQHVIFKYLPKSHVIELGIYVKSFKITHNHLLFNPRFKKLLSNLVLLKHNKEK